MPAAGVVPDRRVCRGTTDTETNWLIVESKTQDFVLRPLTELSFGADAQLRIGSCRTVPDQVGALVGTDDTWWLHNRSDAIGLIVDDAHSASRLTLAPGVDAPLPFREGFVRFGVPAEFFEFWFAVGSGSATNSTREVAGRGARSSGARSSDARISFIRDLLNPDQLLLVVALCEPRLAGNVDPAPPTNRQVAHRLGWTVPKYNRKLDHLCRKLDRLGVAGLKGVLGAAAGYRKVTLIDYAISSSIVGPQDLTLLDPVHRALH